MRRYSRNNKSSKKRRNLQAVKTKRNLRAQYGGTHGNLYVFYHIYCNHNTAPVVNDQCLRIIFSKLYKRVNAIYCFLAGDKTKIDEVKGLIGNMGSKFKIAAEGPDDKTYERFTLEKIPQYIKPEDKFLYIHSKGISDKNFFTGKEVNKDEIFWWRTWMEYYLMTFHEEWLQKLEDFDIVGVNFSDHKNVGKHFSGNFWWTTGKYYLTLPKSIPTTGKLAYQEPEIHIFKGNNPKYHDIDPSSAPKDNGGLYGISLYPKTYIDKAVMSGGGNSEKSAVCAIMIKEEKYVDEWIQYYLYGLGFTKVCIYDNSDENTLKDLPKKYENVVVTHFPGKVKQLPAYNDWLTKNKALPHEERIKWCALFDTDEYLVLKKHANITEFLREYCKDGAVGINWYMYGDSHLQKYSAEPVTKRFTWRQKMVDRHIKSIMNCDNVESVTEFHGIGNFKPGNHNKDTNGKIINGSFNPDGPSDVAIINHYIVKTREEHKEKKNRGRANTVNQTQLRTNAAFNAQNFNEVQDDSAYKIYLKAQENMAKK